jgi:hypothetical protein
MIAAVNTRPNKQNRSARSSMRLPIPFAPRSLCELEHVPSQLNQGDSLRAKDERVYRH